MSDNTFVYVTYIRTTPEKLWTALTDPEFNRQFFLCSYQESDWKVGSSWKLIFPDGRVADSGEILEIDPPRRLVIKWRNEWLPEVKEDGYTRCTFTIEKDGELMKLAVTHEADGPHRLIPNVSKGWPLVLASLKSLLETGKGFERPPSKG
ncbi:ATPase [Mesorhizobium sp. WSM3866]|uniref:SRPBCC family protein n=1 Tax=unclassified Mesorhizobium TaxID=325217 RepID=UPI000BAE7375|nr:MULTISPECIES: SRPBCC family protein [unclassified Mesorhizobium]WIE92359.1 SRPBCC family protein [Mesorhizobium sp. WSM4875]MDG4890476.1 SRPBCC family protein [Mesorhizobium sp. WSM4887]PBB38682.1 ATPase [Mesorhizobium sp. WSM3868]PBB44333.1 ATPase [Mesorhizobium sp. WSM3866]PBB81640.1 ATPase [Mesorhizobium sp. WSM3879]